MPDNSRGRVAGLYIKPPDGRPQSAAQDQVTVAWGGFEGDKHFGQTMPAGSSQKPYPKGVTLRNTRQISILSVEELAEVARLMDIPRIEAHWLSANLLLSGIERLTQLPTGTRLHFEGGVGLVVEGANPPCTVAGGQVQEQYPEQPGLTQAFPQHALGRRGLVAWVERPGVIARGESLEVRLPQSSANGTG